MNMALTDHTPYRSKPNLFLIKAEWKSPPLTPKTKKTAQLSRARPWSSRILAEQGKDRDIPFVQCQSQAKARRTRGTIIDPIRSSPKNEL